MASPIPALRDAVIGAVRGLAIGDALSMPVHWYYNTQAIQSEFGLLADFRAPPKHHPSSIMSLSNTGGAGRGGREGNVIGDVINHGKKKFWGIPGMHYHQGMAAGDNTLNALCARVVLRSIIDGGGRFSAAASLAAYIAFMTTPSSHGDTYAESFHRIFFANYAAGRPAEECSGDDGHNVASMGGFVMIGPPAVLGAATAAAAAGVTLASDGRVNAAAIDPSILEQAERAAADAAVTQLLLTHRSAKLADYARVYAGLLAQVLLGVDLRAAAAAAGRKVGVDVPALVASSRSSSRVASEHSPGGVADKRIIGGTYSSACYIEDSFPSLLYLAHKYADNPEAALIANTNVGGENCHRGSALGVVMGLAHGTHKWPVRWTSGLTQGPAITAEAEAFAAAVVGLFKS